MTEANDAMSEVTNVTEHYLKIADGWINKYAMYGENASFPTMEEVKAFTFMIGFVEKIIETTKSKDTND